MKKIILLIFSTALLFLYIFYRFEINYAIIQAYGQIKLIVEAQKIEKILADKGMSDSLKQELRFIIKVKNYAEDSLGLSKTKNYSTFYDAGNHEINWLVMAAYPFKLKSYEWKFPFAGTFPYLGFFNPKDADKEANKLKAKGFDVKIGHPIAWSTLKIFRDPVLSTMLRYSKGKLAEIIIHESTHATIFIRSDAIINENLANFVGKKGSLRFLTAMYGKNSSEYHHFVKQLTRSKRISHFIVNQSTKLDSLFKNFPQQMSVETKQKKKNSLMQAIQAVYITTMQVDSASKEYIRKDSFFFNNVNYLQSEIYSSKFSFFDSLLRTKYKNNLSQMIHAIKKNPKIIL